MTTLVLTDDLCASGRLIMAAEMAGATARRIACAVGRGPSRMAPWLRQRGFETIGLESFASPSVESAIEGVAVRAEVTRIIMFSSPRALLGLSRLSRLPARPDVDALLPLADADMWGEAEMTAVRALNLITRFVIQDNETAGRLHMHNVPPEKIHRLATWTESTAVSGGDELTFLVHGVFGSGEERARHTAAALRRAGGRAYAIDFRVLAERVLITRERIAPGKAIFVEDRLDSTAPLEQLARRGWRVQRGLGEIGDES